MSHLNFLYSFSIFAQFHSNFQKNYNNNFWMNNSTFWVKNGLKILKNVYIGFFFFDKNRPLKLVWKILYGNFIQKQNFYFYLLQSRWPNCALSFYSPTKFDFTTFLICDHKNHHHYPTSLLHFPFLMHQRYWVGYRVSK